MECHLFLKDISETISQALCELFNKSFSKGLFPDHMKLAMVTSKGKSKLEVSNYRPVSVLPILSKALEKLMFNRLVNFLEKSEIIYEHQYGFQEGKSTIHAVFDIHKRIVTTLDQGNLDCSVFLDFAKAFDTVDHHILLQKLENNGLRGPVFKWFESYLSNRTQKVKIHSVSSVEKPITSGVPQVKYSRPNPCSALYQ